MRGKYPRNLIFPIMKKTMLSGKEKYNSKPTLKFLWQNIKWVFEFNKIKKDLLCELGNYGEKVKIFRHSKDAYEFLVESRV